MVLARSAASTLSALSLASRLAAQQPVTPVRITLEPYAGTSLRTTAVTIAGRTSNLIFDTGGGITLLDVADAGMAGCTPFGRVAGFRATGQLVTSQRCGTLMLTLAGHAIPSEVVAFDLSSIIGKGAPPVGGLLALNSFSEGAITLDFAREQVVLESATSLAERVRSMRGVNVRVTTGAGGDVDLFLEVRAKIGTLWMEVDSGNDGPVFLAPHALEQLGIPAAEARGATVALDVIGLGPVTVRVAPRDMIYDGQLNPAFLRQTVLTIDFRSRRAWGSVVR